MTLRGYLPILLIVSNKGYMPIKSVAEKYLGREEVRSNCSPRHLWSFAASSSLSGKVETSGCIAAHLGLYSCSKFPPSLLLALVRKKFPGFCFSFFQSQIAKCIYQALECGGRGSQYLLFCRSPKNKIVWT
jgi:hypothetical protein